MAKKAAVQNNGESKPKRAKGPRKAFSASVQEKVEKRLASLLKREAKQKSVRDEIAQCETMLRAFGASSVIEPVFPAKGAPGTVAFDEADYGTEDEIE